MSVFGWCIGRGYHRLCRRVYRSQFGEERRCECHCHNDTEENAPDGS